MRNAIPAAAVLLTLGAAGSAQAAVVTFDVDPTRSILTLGAAGVGGETGYAQAGGDARSYTGTIRADIVGNTINILSGGYEIVAGSSATPMAPGNAPANYAIFTIDSDYTAALRDFKFDFQKFGAAPFTIAPDGTLLDPDQGDLPYSPDLVGSATIDYDVFFPDSLDEDTSFYNLARPPGTDAPRLFEDNGVLTLEIPVVTFITWSTLGAGDSQFQLVGKIVATTVPEPAAISTLVLGAGLLMARRRRHA